MRAHIATESRHRDSTATAAGPESRRAYQPSAPATAMMQSRGQPFRLSAHNHTFARTCASSLAYHIRSAYNMRSAAKEASEMNIYEMHDCWLRYEKIIYQNSYLIHEPMQDVCRHFFDDWLLCFSQTRLVISLSEILSVVPVTSTWCIPAIRIIWKFSFHQSILCYQGNLLCYSLTTFSVKNDILLEYLTLCIWI